MGSVSRLHTPGIHIIYLLKGTSIIQIGQICASSRKKFGDRDVLAALLWNLLAMLLWHLTRFNLSFAFFNVNILYVICLSSIIFCHVHLDCLLLRHLLALLAGNLNIIHSIPLLPKNFHHSGLILDIGSHLRTLLVWHLDIGYRILDIGYQISDIGYRILDIGYQILDIVYWIFEIGYWILDPT